MKLTKSKRKKCNKIPYATKREASSALATMKREDKLVATGSLHVYRCTHCPGKVYHLGNREL